MALSVFFCLDVRCETRDRSKFKNQEQRKKSKEKRLKKLRVYLCDSCQWAVFKDQEQAQESSSSEILHSPPSTTLRVTVENDNKQ